MLELPIRIGSLELANRLVLPPMATEKTEAGVASKALCDYYRERSGKIGLIITEHAYVLKEGKASTRQLSLGPDADLESLRRLVDAIHAKETTKVIAQISHAGQYTTEEIIGQAPITVDGLSVEEIAHIQQAFVDAALRAKQVGYDGVEIHCAHGFLLNQFYSPLTNHRTDAYSGATLEGRTRFQCEIIRMVREAVGAAYPVIFRFGAYDHIEGGSTLAEIGEAAKIFVAAGLDMIDVSGGLVGFCLKNNTEAGYFSAESERVKQAVTVPVLLTGGIHSREEAEMLLEAGQCDMIGIGRPILNDAKWIDLVLDVD